MFWPRDTGVAGSPPPLAGGLRGVLTEEMGGDAREAEEMGVKAGGKSRETLEIGDDQATGTEAEWGSI